jgi:hypothetical protein
VEEAESSRSHKILDVDVDLGFDSELKLEAAQPNLLTLSHRRRQP